MTSDDYVLGVLFDIVEIRLENGIPIYIFIIYFYS